MESEMKEKAGRGQSSPGIVRTKGTRPLIQLTLIFTFKHCVCHFVKTDKPINNKEFNPTLLPLDICIIWGFKRKLGGGQISMDASCILWWSLFCCCLIFKLTHNCVMCDCPTWMEKKRRSKAFLDEQLELLTGITVLCCKGREPRGQPCYHHSPWELEPINACWLLQINLIQKNECQLYSIPLQTKASCDSTMATDRLMVAINWTRKIRHRLTMRNKTGEYSEWKTLIFEDHGYFVIKAGPLSQQWHP